LALPPPLQLQEFGMDTNLEPIEYDLSPAKSRSLFIAALLMSLLGLTTLDVAPSDHTKKRHVGDVRSFDCIVASAVFAGVNASSPAGAR
jgi:hypothetical protein